MALMLNGVYQGSVLNALLFAIVVDVLTRQQEADCLRVAELLIYTCTTICKGEIWRRLSLGRAAMPGLNKIWKDKDITITTKCRIVNALVSPVVLYGCESGTIRKAERRRIDSFELWCWRRLLRIPWTARRTNKSVIEEINANNPLEATAVIFRTYHAKRK